MAVSKTTNRKTRSKKMGRARKEPDLEVFSGRVAARLRKLSDDRNWDAEQLSQQLRVLGKEATKDALYAYMRGDRDVPLDLVPYLAEAFGISVRAFFPPE